MHKTTMFKSGNSYAVRVPKDMQFDEKKVVVSRVGDTIVIVPESKAVEKMVSTFGKFGTDFLEPREQPPLEDRPGL